MNRRRLLAIASIFALALPVASAHAELAKWDQAKVTALSKQLTDAAKALQDTFLKQPPPSMGSGDSRDFYRLKQLIRRIRQEANDLSGDLQKGEGKEETQAASDDLMTNVRDAREVASRIFATADMKERATAVRTVLNQIAPYYDPDAVPLEPVTR